MWLCVAVPAITARYTATPVSEHCLLLLKVNRKHCKPSNKAGLTLKSHGCRNDGPMRRGLLCHLFTGELFAVNVTKPQKSSTEERELVTCFTQVSLETRGELSEVSVQNIRNTQINQRSRVTRTTSSKSYT